MRHSRVFVSVVAIFVLSLVSACSSDSSTPTAQGGAGAGGEAAAAPTKSRGVIGISLLTRTNPFFNVIADSLEKEAAKSGYELIVVSGEFDAAKQQNQVQDFVVKKVAAIVLTPCDSKAVGAAIQIANDAGIPVFTADIKCLAPDVKVVSHVATDNLQGGKLAAEAIIEALGEQGGKVAILDLKSVESCLLRVQGFKEVIEEHNASGGSQIEIVAELPGGGVKDQGFKAAEDALQAHSDLDGIFAINDPSALGASAALEKAGKSGEIVVVAFDGQPEGKAAIAAGTIYADPVQFPDEIGRTTAQLIVKHLEGEEVAPEVLIPTSLFRQQDAIDEQAAAQPVGAPADSAQ